MSRQVPPEEALEFFAKGSGFANVVMLEPDGSKRRFARGSAIPREHIERLSYLQLAMRIEEGTIGLRVRAAVLA